MKLLALILAAVASLFASPAAAQSVGPATLTQQHYTCDRAVSTGRQYTDNFDCGLSLAERPGWKYLSVGQSLEGLNYLQSNTTSSSDGRATHPLLGQDLGRLDGGSIQFVTSNMSLVTGLLFNYVNPANYFIVQTSNTGSRVQINCVHGSYASSASTSIYDNGDVTGKTVLPGTQFRVDWSWSGTTITIKFYTNGVLYTTARTATFAQCGMLPSSWAGFDTASMYNMDNYRLGLLDTAPLTRVTLDIVNKNYSRTLAGSVGIPLSGDAIGATNIEFRLLQAGAVVSGWDWGQQSWASFTYNGGKWSGVTPAITAGTGYTIEVRATNDTLASSKSRVFGIGINGVVWGQSLAVQMLNTTLTGGGHRTVTTPSDAYFLTFNGPIRGDVVGKISPALVPTGAIPESVNNPYDLARWTDWVGDVSVVSGGSGGLTDSTAGFLLGVLRNGTTLPLGISNWASCGSSAMTKFLPTDTSVCTAVGPNLNRYQNLLRLLDVYGKDIEYLVWSQGQEDAGRSPNTPTSFTAAQATAYISNFDTTMTAVRAYVGRTAAQMPVIVIGAERMGINCSSTYSTVLNNGTNGACGTSTGTNCNSGSASSPCSDDSWDRFRYTQWQISQLSSKNYILGHSQVDLALEGSYPATFPGAVHLGGDNNLHAGSTEDAYRTGLDIGKALGLRATDGRGPLPGTPVRSGSTLAITFAMNGTDTLTCACGATPPTNFYFYTDSAYTTQITPSSFAISGNVATWTFGSALPSGVVVVTGKTPPNRAFPSTGGIYPDIANYLTGTRTSDSITVMTDNIFVPLVSN